MTIEYSNDGFLGKAKEPGGLVSVAATAADGVLRLRCHVARITSTPRVPADLLFAQLQQLDYRHKCTIDRDGETQLLGVEIGIAADGSLSIPRLSALKQELGKIADIAAAVQENIAEAIGDPTLKKLWQPLQESVAPVVPLRLRFPASLMALAADAHACMSASLPVALAAPSPLREKLALAAMAQFAREHGGPTLGEVTSYMPIKSLIEMASHAPGHLACPVRCLSMSTGEQYEMTGRLRSFYAEAQRLPYGVCFTGSDDELSDALGGGQGAAFTALEPVILRCEDVLPKEFLIDAALELESRSRRAVSAADRKRIRVNLREAFEGVTDDDVERLLQPAVRSEIAARDSSRGQSSRDFVASLRGRTETFSGATAAGLAHRSTTAQRRMVGVVCEPSFADTLKASILAQDDAIDAVVDRLRQESLTRSARQPVRMLLQGTAATGKSETGKLIAAALDWPHHTIDCGGIADYYTFSAQLLGSGRGIVNSYQPGRLESIARHVSGSVLEVADIDHAPATIRAAICDLFLLALETGTGQSSAGGTFNVCNVLFVFTCNLPGRKDESARNALGFREADERDAEESILRELKQIMSSAFLSRVGAPICFRPLEGAALETIAARELERAVRLAALHSGGSVLDEVRVSPAAARRCVELARRRLLSSGARALLEQARSTAARAYLDHLRAGGARCRRLAVVLRGGAISITGQSHTTRGAR